jgi:hypothetical protein
MAFIDVSELMSDPDFVDPITVINRTESLNSFGQATLLEAPVESVGSVQPANYRTVQKLPEAMRVANVCSFWVRGAAIIASSDGRYASILVFRGVRYQVQTVADWSNFGEGYTEGTCVAEKPT